MIIDYFPEYDGYQNYILTFTVMIILLACKAGSSGFNKSASIKEKKFMKVLLIIVITCIVLITLEIVLKRFGVIP